MKTLALPWRLDRSLLCIYDRENEPVWWLSVPGPGRMSPTYRAELADRLQFVVDAVNAVRHLTPNAISFYGSGEQALTLALQLSAGATDPDVQAAAKLSTGAHDPETHFGERPTNVVDFRHNNRS